MLWLVSVRYRQQRVRKCNDRQEKHYHKCTHICYHLNDESDEEAVFLENSEEIEQLEPHEEDSNCLQGPFDFGVDFDVESVDEEKGEDGGGGDDVDVVPEHNEVVGAVVLHLDDFILQKVAGVEAKDELCGQIQELFY